MARAVALVIPDLLGGRPLAAVVGADAIVSAAGQEAPTPSGRRVEAIADRE